MRPVPEPWVPAHHPQQYPGGPPQRKRGYGALLLVGALCWVASTVLAWMAVFGGILLLLRGVHDQLDPTAGGRSFNALGATSLAMLLGAGALVVIGLALDVWITVASARRLRGDRGDRVIPIIALVSVCLAVVLPVMLMLLFLAAAAAELTQVADALGWALSAVLLVIAPLSRLTQGVAGLVRTATGELPAVPFQP